MDLNCPYCNRGFDVDHDDGQGYEENVIHQMECPNCDKNFVFQTSISYYYEPYKADCLNGGDHDWELTETIPKGFSKMYCTMCDEHRDMTDAEREKFNIGSKKSYIDKLKK